MPFFKLSKNNKNNKNYFCNNFNKRAFSLLELSIVLIIISLIVSAGLTVSTNSIINTKIKNSNDRIKEVYKAIGNFIIINNRLPCPASLLKNKINDSSYGIEVGANNLCIGDGVFKSSNNGNIVAGAVPIKALGLAVDMSEDGFENKFIYVIDKNFTNNFSDADYENIITIIEKPGNTDQIATNDAILAIISYGNNGFGAFSGKNSQQQELGNDADEQENQLANPQGGANSQADFDNRFVASATNSEIFDDIIFFKGRNQIIQDFQAFDALKCPEITENYYGTNFIWPKSNYNQIVLSQNNCPTGFLGGAIKPSKRCGAFGIWQESLINPCTPNSTSN
jgi:prepilin-type N-terminal cleavage/methylation domain-containing protein